MKTSSDLNLTFNHKHNILSQPVSLDILDTALMAWPHRLHLLWARYLLSYHVIIMWQLGLVTWGCQCWWPWPRPRPPCPAARGEPVPGPPSAAVAGPWPADSRPGPCPHKRWHQTQAHWSHNCNCYTEMMTFVTLSRSDLLSDLEMLLNVSASVSPRKGENPERRM